MTEPGVADPGLSEWDAVLGIMENSVEQAVALEHEQTEHEQTELDLRAWALPSDIGPLPEELRERAQRLLDAQKQRVAELELRQRTVGRHLAALRTVPASTDGASSPYLDVTG